MRRFAAAFVVVSATLGGHAQSRAIVQGRVVAGDTGDALRNARVVVTSSRELPPLLTDGDGLFSFSPPADGPLTVTIAKPGYAKTTLTVQEAPDLLTVAMPKGAVISGTVMDDRGDPVIGASVIVETAVPEGRRPTVLAAPMTDDLGEYRAGSLPAEPVMVSIFATPTTLRMMPPASSGPSIIARGSGNPWQRVYYPGVATTAQAAIFSLRPGDEKAGVSFTVNAESLGPGIHVPVLLGRDSADKTSAVISGRVLRPGGRPLTGASVRLMPSAATMAPLKLAITDVDGRYQFVLPQAAAGTYRVIAGGVSQGYLDTAFGQQRPSDRGEEITVAGGETRHQVMITMMRPGVIAGRLFDEYGDPVEGVVVRASQVRYLNGRRRLVDLAGAQPTDDLGRYRLSGLEPGEYLVSAAVGQIDMRAPLVDLPGYGTTYFPGSPNPSEAQRVLVSRSQEVLSVDFPIVRVRTARVSGRAVDSKGEAITGGIALTPSRRSGAVVAMPMGARIERDGRFEFPNVAPGDYVLQASRHRSTAWSEGESSSQFVAVNGVDMTDLEVRTSAGSTLDGSVVLEGGGALTPGQLNVSPVPIDSDLSPLIGGGPAVATADQDSRFHLAGLTGPRRLRVTHLPPGWTLQAILLNGIDITDTPLPFGTSDQSLADVQVVLSQRVTSVSGRVTDRGHSVAAAILFFAADRQAWYPQSRFFGQTMSAADGSFRVEGLPPGEYLAAAVDAAPVIRGSDQWQDPDYLETLAARARRLTLADGGNASLSLTVVGR